MDIKTDLFWIELNEIQTKGQTQGLLDKVKALNTNYKTFSYLHKTRFNNKYLFIFYKRNETKRPNLYTHRIKKLPINATR